MIAAAERSGADYAVSTGGGGLKDVEIDARTDGTQVSVTVSGQAMDIVAGLAPRISATVSSPVEQFREDT